MLWLLLMLQLCLNGDMSIYSVCIAPLLVRLTPFLLKYCGKNQSNLDLVWNVGRPHKIQMLFVGVLLLNYSGQGQSKPSQLSRVLCQKYATFNVKKRA